MCQGKGLAAKLGGQVALEARPVRHPRLLLKLAASLMAPEWDARIEELLFHAYACPWLQALLKACASTTCCSSPMHEPHQTLALNTQHCKLFQPHACMQLIIDSPASSEAILLQETRKPSCVLRPQNVSHHPQVHFEQ